MTPPPSDSDERPAAEPTTSDIIPTRGNRTRRLVLGLVMPKSTTTDLSALTDDFVRFVGQSVKVDIERRDAASYESLANDMRDGHVHVAWLPPIVFIRLGDAVKSLGTIVRDGHSTYEAVLVVKRSSKITKLESLRGTRAGWVDPWSASGFVVQRVGLAARGVDPRTLFRTERFHGSHRAAVESLLEGACDVAGTYARTTNNDESTTTGQWAEIANGAHAAEVHVVARFGPIPPDVIGVRSDLDEPMRVKLFDALKAACEDPDVSKSVRELFGGNAVKKGLAPGYDELASSLEGARGLFD